MKKLIGIITLFTTVFSLYGEEQLLQIEKANSKVEVAVNVTAHSFVASLENYDLKIMVDTESAKILNTEFSFDFEDLKTGKKARDKAMLKWEEHHKFPTATFVLAKIHELGEKIIAEGKLTLHGIEKDISFPINVHTEGPQWTIDGSTIIDHLDWDLPIVKVLVLKVDPELTVTIHVEGMTH